MDKIRSLLASLFLSIATALHSETVSRRISTMGLGGPGPWTPGK